nr:unnamed protein product [Digitaria exilis]
MDQRETYLAQQAPTPYSIAFFMSQYVIDTDGKGEVPNEQHSNLRTGNLLRFAVRDESVRLVDGKMQTGFVPVCCKACSSAN